MLEERQKCDGLVEQEGDLNSPTLLEDSVC
jgi:hypothetical protein